MGQHKIKNAHDQMIPEQAEESPLNGLSQGLSGNGPLTNLSEALSPQELQDRDLANTPLDLRAKYPFLNQQAEAAIKREEIRKQEGNKLTFEKQKYADQAIDNSFKAHKDFIDSTTKQQRSFDTETKPKLLQLQKLNKEQLISPKAAKFYELMGLPISLSDNPSNELFQKTSQDLLKGLPDTYGSRILQVEVENFLKTIPTLMNSPEGRRMVISNMLKLGEMKSVLYNEMRKQEQEYLSQNKPLPRDFEQQVQDKVKPEIDRISNKHQGTSRARIRSRGKESS
jgi:hypothetical protein